LAIATAVETASVMHTSLY